MDWRSVPCWDYEGSRWPRGYGIIPRSVLYALHMPLDCLYAHRFAYTYHYGPIPFGLFVCHHCDRPSCCEPRHLFLGTATVNNRDAIVKGRASSKLTDAQVLEVYELALKGEPDAVIAARFGVPVGGVKCIRLNRTRRYLKRDHLRLPEAVSQPGERHPGAKLTDANVHAIRASSEPYTVLAERYGVAKVTIQGVRRRYSWRHLA
jgi:hypothetical protein